MTVSVSRDMKLVVGFHRSCHIFLNKGLVAVLYCRILSWVVPLKSPIGGQISPFVFPYIYTHCSQEHVVIVKLVFYG